MILFFPHFASSPLLFFKFYFFLIFFFFLFVVFWLFFSIENLCFYSTPSFIEKCSPSKSFFRQLGIWQEANSIHTPGAHVNAQDVKARMLGSLDFWLSDAFMFWLCPCRWRVVIFFAALMGGHATRFKSSKIVFQFPLNHISFSSSALLEKNVH